MFLTNPRCVVKSHEFPVRKSKAPGSIIIFSVTYGQAGVLKGIIGVIQTPLDASLNLGSTSAADYVEEN